MSDTSNQPTLPPLTDITDALEVLRSRMETNPEDLLSHRWSGVWRVVTDNKDLFTPEEQTLLAHLHRCLQRRRFASSVMQSLLAHEQDIEPSFMGHQTMPYTPSVYITNTTGGNIAAKTANTWEEWELKKLEAEQQVVERLKRMEMEGERASKLARLKGVLESWKT